jgi:hypothetical protein
VVENPFLQVVVKANTARTKAGPKYSEIWNPGILLEHILNGPKLKELPWREQMGRIAAIWMIFVPCRPCAMFRMDPTTEKQSADGKTITIRAQDKTDIGKGVTVFTLRSMAQEAFSPATHYQVLRTGSKRRGSEEALWCAENGKPYKRVDNIRKFLAKILKDAKIPDVYKPYSIRHAVITALFQAGFNEREVNAYTGHSNNSHTALNYYYHLDRMWAGKTLAELAKPIAVTPEIQAAIDRDHEEGGNEDKEDFELDAKNLFRTDD